MQHIQTDILVIGGGATGTGVLRDLAMRGLKCLLVERRDLAYGTTGRYHGLLHSGGRYVVKDPQAARECYQENLVLRRIMQHCIEDTGGYFVLAPGDDPAYVPLFLAGCQAAGIPVEDIPIARMLKDAPLLNPAIQQCFLVPDASADSFLAAQLNVESARQHGAAVMTYHELERLLVSAESSTGKRVIAGAVCRGLVKDEEVQIEASMVVNASGAWAGKIAATAGINIDMVPGKGTMIALNHRLVNQVVNRCKPPADGDILVPAHSVSVMGTTDIQVTDPDHYAIEPWEIRLMLDEGEKIIPTIKNFRILRLWAGVRPLVKSPAASSDRDISRAFVLLDHAERDGVDGLLTITSGKWTTYRKMAEVTADKVSEKLGVTKPCRTHLEVLPSHQPGNPSYHYLGVRLGEVEQEADYGRLVCECELVTRTELEQAVIQSDAPTLDDIRRGTRLGMGPCQGAFCSLRATGIMHTLRCPPVEQSTLYLRDFLQERWKGNLPVLSGEQLHQARFNELIYANVLNIDSLPGRKSSPLAEEAYSRPAEEHFSTESDRVRPKPPNVETDRPPQQDVLVIGAGLAGLFAAYQISAKGYKTGVISRGWGTPYWSSGCIDVIGYSAPEYQATVDSPYAYLESQSKENPLHPYSLAGKNALEESVKSFQALAAAHGYPMRGSLDKNIWIPTALGALRPTCLLPESMTAGDAALRTPMLIVGFDQLLDFHPALVADNLNAQGMLASDLSIDLPTLRRRRFVTGMVLARLFDTPEFRQEVIAAVKPKLINAGRVGFPAVLGIRDASQVLTHLQTGLGVPVFEIPGLPPLIPGIRLHNLLVAAIQESNGSVFNGLKAVDATMEDKRINAVRTEAAVRYKSHRARTFILATGGILGGGITADLGYAQETVFNLPIHPQLPYPDWFASEFLAPGGHPLFRSGIATDMSFQPINSSGAPLYENLYAIGSLLTGCDPVREHSIEGIALASGYRVAQVITARLP